MANLLAHFIVIHSYYPEIVFEAPGLSTSYLEMDSMLPFENYFNISKFPFIVSRIPDGLEELESTEFTFGYGFYPANATVNVSIPTIEKFAKLLDEAKVNTEKEKMLRLLLEFPSENLKNETSTIRNSLLSYFNVSSFSCMHLRVEDDFKNYFKQKPAYYSPEEIARKINKTISLKIQNSEAFPSELLFIAGNIDDSVLEPFLSLNIWKNITQKGHFMKFNVTKIPKTFYAALDFEICKMADLFIGNNHSSWSELLADFLLWVRGKIWEKEVLMINSPGEKSDDSQLYPFCSANHKTRHKSISCTYYRPGM